jgi:hypothetical protein
MTLVRSGSQRDESRRASEPKSLLQMIRTDMRLILLQRSASSSA